MNAYESVGLPVEPAEAEQRPGQVLVRVCASLQRLKNARDARGVRRANSRDENLQLRRTAALQTGGQQQREQREAGDEQQRVRPELDHCKRPDERREERVALATRAPLRARRNARRRVRCCPLAVRVRAQQNAARRVVRRRGLDQRNRHVARRVELVLRRALGDRLPRRALGDRLLRRAFGDRLLRRTFGDRLARRLLGDCGERFRAAQREVRSLGHQLAVLRVVVAKHQMDRSLHNRPIEQPVYQVKCTRVECSQLRPISTNTVHRSNIRKVTVTVVTD